MKLEQAFMPSQRCPAYGLPGISAVLASPVWYEYILLIPLFRAGIFKHSMAARNRVQIGLSYRPARLHSLAKLIPGLLKRLKIRILDAFWSKSCDIWWFCLVYTWGLRFKQVADFHIWSLDKLLDFPQNPRESLYFPWFTQEYTFLPVLASPLKNYRIQKGHFYLKQAGNLAKRSKVLQLHKYWVLLLITVYWRYSLVRTATSTRTKSTVRRWEATSSSASAGKYSFQWRKF